MTAQDVRVVEFWAVIDRPYRPVKLTIRSWARSNYNPGQEAMSDLIAKSEKLFRWFEIAIIAAMQLLLVMLIVISTITLYGLFVQGVRKNIGEIGSAEDLHGVLQSAIGGVLIVLLGLELMETLKSYFSE